MSNRRSIVEHIVNQLKNIDGGISSYDSSYTYTHNLHDNVYRKLKFIDEVNDFPAVYVSAGAETRKYNTLGLTEGLLFVLARCYVNSEDPITDIETLIDDVDHVIYNIPSLSNIGLMEMTITSIERDLGLLAPYGIAEILISISYKL